MHKFRQQIKLPFGHPVPNIVRRVAGKKKKLE